MAQLGNLIVTGVSRLLSKLYVSDSVTAPTFIGKLQGNADSATKVNGHTVNSDVPSDAKFTDTNTWRGVQNNLTSTATDQSLAANQGKVLKGYVDTLSKNTLTFTNVSIATSAFVSDSTYSDYPYRVDITCSGVTDAYVPNVNLAIAQATSGNFSPISVSGANKVSIYSKEKESATFTIPSIICMKGGA